MMRTGFDPGGKFRERGEEGHDVACANFLARIHVWARNVKRKELAVAAERCAEALEAGYASPAYSLKP